MTDTTAYIRKQLLIEIDDICTCADIDPHDKHTLCPFCPYKTIHDAADALAAHQEVLQSFVDNQIEYMRVNNLGDGEKQHNVKWARKVMGTLPPKEESR